MYEISARISGLWDSYAHKMLWIMKMTMFILLVSISPLQASNVFGQRINYVRKQASLEQIFKEIKKQTSYNIVWFEDNLNTKITQDVNFKNAAIEAVMDRILSNQPASYEINNKTIIIKSKVPGTGEKLKKTILNFFEALIDVTGRVVDEHGEPLPGAKVKVNGVKNITTSTNANGEFTLKGIEDKATITISFIGYESKELPVSGNMGTIKLVQTDAKLEEVQINAGYYTVSERARTGNIQKITASTIEKQPISNPLQAMQNRVPGVQITQTTGISGGGINVQIRGRSSISNLVGNDPLYIIDGVIYPSNKVSLNYVNNILGTSGSNPLSMISPTDIESIEVLKDADATAIYGSRGANGVILIKTKHGEPGKPRINAGYTQGFSRVAGHIDLLNTRQYLEMRNEALKNDGKTPSSTDYDINGTWDPNKYTDWQKELIGGTSASSNAKLNFTGGTENITYLLGATYYKEGTVFPGELNFNRIGLQSSLIFGSENSRLNVNFTTNYNHINNDLIRTDLTSYITLAPNAPDPYDQYGQLNWSNKTVYQNPMAYLLAKNKLSSDNLIGNITLNYKILKNLAFRTSAGYNLVKTDEFSKIPLAYISPANSPTAANRAAYFSNISNRTWIVEPQLNYHTKLGLGNLEALLGMSFQENTSDLRSVKGANFSSDELLGNLGAAGTLTNNLTVYSQYRYIAAFARLNYNIESKYFLNLTARRDGSSRFGGDKQFANFGAIGAAWIFSEEKMIKDNFPFLSLGKLRASYGLTGNDQIPDYGYLQLYNTSGTYQGISTLIPSSSNIGNPDFAWETNRKLEFALQFSLFNDRVTVETSWYRNRSDNQLIGDPLPLSTGSLTVRANRPALVQNTGWEFLANFKLLNHTNWRWSVGINLTIPTNKLISYPDIEKSSDAINLIVGKPLSIYKIYNVRGVNSQTGLYDIEDYDGNGVINDNDRYLYKFTGQYYYGGLQNTIAYKGFNLDLLLGFTKQNGYNYISSLSTPGLWSSNNYPTGNQPAYVLDRWQSPNDQTSVQKFTTISNSASPYNDARNYGGINIGNASYIRLKNIALSYAFKGEWLSKMKINKADLMLSGQNIFTITNYKGLDPETQSMTVLPPLKTWAIGINLTF
jgi:TonB-linked SusC/RagA family outer membrane protein